MNVQALRAFTASGTASFRRVLISVFAVVAVVFGLLAMHSMTLTTSAHPESSQGPAAVSGDTAMDNHQGVLPSDAAAQAALLPGLIDDCGGSAHCAMLGMACVMALLTVALTLLLRGPTTSNFLGFNAARAVAALAPLVTLPRPPSLVALSISRT